MGRIKNIEEEEKKVKSILTIGQVYNGYIVKFTGDDKKMHTYVFNHLEHLYEWLQKYFNDQVEPIANDSAEQDRIRTAAQMDTRPNLWHVRDSD